MPYEELTSCCAKVLGCKGSKISRQSKRMSEHRSGGDRQDAGQQCLTREKAATRTAKERAPREEEADCACGQEVAPVLLGIFARAPKYEGLQRGSYIAGGHGGVELPRANCLKAGDLYRGNEGNRRHNKRVRHSCAEEEERSQDRDFDARAYGAELCRLETSALVKPKRT